MVKQLLDAITAQGDKGAVVPFSRIEDLKCDMTALKEGEFHTSWLDRMTNHMLADAAAYSPADMNFTPQSLISVVMPSPNKVILRFAYRGRPFQCAVPGHYSDWEFNNERVLRNISDCIAPLGYSVSMARTVPQKLLAVHCGLALYGRNNISYNDTFGSHTQIMAYISDLPCEEHAWFPLGRMERCESCSACVAACPTGAIASDRRLINTDRCITFFNESKDAFPEWLNPNAHNSIIGCTKCQDCCPGNAHNKDHVVEGVAFTQEETMELLRYADDTPYSDSLAAKLKQTGISPEFIDFFPRNLAALLQKTYSQ